MEKKEIYKDSSYTPRQRAEDLLGRMTPEEKAAQLLSLPTVDIQMEGMQVNVPGLRERIPYGLGSFQLPGRHFRPEDSARAVNRLQEIVMEQSRFSIPALIQEECLSGHVARGSSMFPKPIGLACTFDTELVRQVYDAIGREAGARGGSQAFTPVLDLGRDLRWGRLEETFGEDVCLVSKMGYAAVVGLQGGTEGVSAGHVAASVKHFAGYGQCQGGRNFAPCHVTGRELADEILPPFYQAIVRGKARGVMPSHSEIDGVPCHAGRWLLDEILRKKWGFDGVVVSDYFDVSRLETVHHIAEDRKEAAVLALQAGVDMDIPDGLCFALLPEICREHTEVEALLNRAALRVLQLKFELGLFEHPFAEPEKAAETVRCRKHCRLAGQAALESIVLLKNEGSLLPLAGEQRIAVIGPCAHPVHFSYYSTAPNEGISIYEGIRELEKEYRLDICYEKGCGLTKQEFSMDTEVDATMMEEPELYSRQEEEAGMQRAVALAEGCDVIVACVGGSASTSREAIFKNNSSGDNDTLELVGQQKELLNRLAKTGKPLVVISVGGKPYSSQEIYEASDAALQCFYAGQETGRAVAALLFGKEAPSGRMPVTIPYGVGQLPVYYSQRSSGLMKGYLLGAKAPRFPFGYGLGYTSFAIQDIRAEKAWIRQGESLRISAVVKNTGQREGTEVVQLYLRDKKASVTRPGMELKDFRRVFLAPQEEKCVEFTITEEMLMFTKPDGSFGSEPGEFEAMIGKNARDYVTYSFQLEE